MKLILIRLFALILLGLPFAARAAEGTDGDACLYRKNNPVKLPGTLASTKGEDSTSLFLRGGTYINLVEWSCSRLGKRIYIAVPSSKDSVNYISDLLTKIAEVPVAHALKGIVRSSFEREDFSTSLDIQGFELVSYSVRRTDYESTYIVTYYTAD
jgi:hypothetical protein